MDTSVLLMANVILWSTGLSILALAVLLGLDWLEGRRTQSQNSAMPQADARLDSLLVKKPQQAKAAPRRRPSAVNPTAAKAA